MVWMEETRVAVRSPANTWTASAARLDLSFEQLSAAMVGQLRAQFVSDQDARDSSGRVASATARVPTSCPRTRSSCSSHLHRSDLHRIMIQRSVLPLVGSGACGLIVRAVGRAAARARSGRGPTCRPVPTGRSPWPGRAR